MNKKQRSAGATEVREMRAEYRFDYSKARPNPYAAQLGKDTVTVMLDPDVAEVFKTAQSVNELLRAVIAALPNPARRRTKRKAG